MNIPKTLSASPIRNLRLLSLRAEMICCLLDGIHSEVGMRIRGFALAVIAMAATGALAEQRQKAVTRSPGTKWGKEGSIAVTALRLKPISVPFPENKPQAYMAV